METTVKKSLRGGEFLIRETSAGDVFIPEEFTEEQKAIIESCHDFLDKEVIPKIVEIDEQKPGLTVSLLEKSGEQGLLGLSVPEQYGGIGADFVTSMIGTEALGPGHSFSVSFGAHTGIGTLPIVYYGTEEQKKKYLPKLASGEWKSCYCLTEPNAGSDANSGKSKAVLSPDGKHYIINGQKMWITNAGFADVFIMFAKIDNDQNLSAFIVDKSCPGIKLNPEEHKMGIKGSSTRQVFFEDCKVPVENLLSERGNGFKIAVNILNIGRVKLAAGALGASKMVVTKSVNYANERVQFGKPISTFGAIKYKLAEQSVRIYASESALYRASKNIEDAIERLIAEGVPDAEAKLKGIAQFAPEAAIMKVHGSETLDYVVDEGVQIFGGMGYSADAPMERAYRDSRINRIFEGTNEINRLLTVDMILKRAMKGELDLLGPAKKVADELFAVPDMSTGDGELFSAEKRYITGFKKAILMCAGAAAQKLMTKLEHEQEIIMNIADMLIDLYISESVQLRVEKLTGIRGEAACKDQVNMMRIYINDAADRIYKAGKDAICSFTDGDEQRIMLMGLKRFTKTDPYNSKNARREIAAKLIEENRYCF
ncbi:MAG: acyl-CoA dehydrogenase family protein [Bacteroidetes bacterium]|nr:acyl-CoA dehydrogenase family protein [Bacteroidota bacterium]